MAKLVTNADIQLPATTEDLRTVLGPALSRYFGVPSVISCLERTTSQYSTSYPLEEITVTLQDGRRLGGLTIVNPFRTKNNTLIDRILPP